MRMHIIHVYKFRISGLFLKFQYLIIMGESLLSLSLRFVWARRTGRKYGTLISSTGGPKSLSSMNFDGVSSLKMALLMRRSRGEPCSGSNTTLFSKPTTSELKLHSTHGQRVYKNITILVHTFCYILRQLLAHRAA